MFDMRTGRLRSPARYILAPYWEPLLEKPTKDIPDKLVPSLCTGGCLGLFDI